MRFRATCRCGVGRNSDGSSTVPRSFCSLRRASSSTGRLARGAGCGWGRCWSRNPRDSRTLHLPVTRPTRRISRGQPPRGRLSGGNAGPTGRKIRARGGGSPATDGPGKALRTDRALKGRQRFDPPTGDGGEETFPVPLQGTDANRRSPGHRSPSSLSPGLDSGSPLGTQRPKPWTGNPVPVGDAARAPVVWRRRRPRRPTGPEAWMHGLAAGGCPSREW